MSTRTSSSTENSPTAANATAVDTGTIRKFETGATRDTATDKHDYEAFVSPLVTRRYGKFMHKHRKQSDGSLRAGDNWQKGIPIDQYVKSLVRHVEDVRLIHDGYQAWDNVGLVEVEDALCAIIFNASGILFERLKTQYSKTSEVSSG